MKNELHFVNQLFYEVLSFCTTVVSGKKIYFYCTGQKFKIVNKIYYCDKLETVKFVMILNIVYIRLIQTTLQFMVYILMHSSKQHLIAAEMLGTFRIILLSVLTKTPLFSSHISDPCFCTAQFVAQGINCEAPKWLECFKPFIFYGENVKPGSLDRWWSMQIFQFHVQ